MIVFAFFIALGFHGGDRLASSNLYLYRWPEQWKIGGHAMAGGDHRRRRPNLDPLVAHIDADMDWLPAPGVGIPIYVGMLVGFALLNLARHQARVPTNMPT